MLSFGGYNHTLIRDLVFLTDDILQIIPYESELPKIESTLKQFRADVILLKDFDPTNPSSYDFDIGIDAEALKGRYFLILKAAQRRLKDLNSPRLKRTISFLENVIIARDVN